MKINNLRYFHFFVLCLALLSLTGCFDWWRAYRTYLQMDEFDQHFAISVADDFTLHFKDPILYSDDFVSLAKLTPSQKEKNSTGKIWHYRFQKVDEKGHVYIPEVMFSFDLTFNQDDRILAWTFSPLFLQIAPAEFLEISFRSLGSGEINKENKQLKVNTDNITKINAALPHKSVILAKLGKPIAIERKEQQDILIYHFKLQSEQIFAGYEDRQFSTVKLYFDDDNQEMVKMAGNFAGLKLAIDYRKYQLKQKNLTI